MTQLLSGLNSAENQVKRITYTATLRETLEEKCGTLLSYRLLLRLHHAEECERAEDGEDKKQVEGEISDRFH